MTYNIRGTKGMDNQHSPERIAEVIRESGAQIVCLQEVHQRMAHSKFVDQPKVLSRSLGMKTAFGINLRIGIGNYGNAVLTTFDIVGSKNHSLTSKGEPRGTLEVSLMTPEGPLTVFCSHFGLDREERATQAQELAALVNAAPSPKIVCGDFNETSPAKGVSTLLELTDLIDAYAEGPPTFDAANPTDRIDFIFHDPSVVVDSIRLVDTQASDHLPIVADLSFGGPA